MSGIIFKANINECKVENWQSNTGEVNVRELKVEMTEELSNCDNQFVTFKLADGTKHESKVTDGKADIPIFDKPQFIKIGLYTEDVVGDKCEKRYSPRPANVYVSTGSYPDGTEKTPTPTPGTYAELLKKIEEMSQDGGITEITEDTFVYDLAPGIYKINAADDSYCIYMDDCYWLCLYEGIVSFSYSEYENMYSWFYVGRDMSNGSTALFGRTHWNGEYWVCDDYRDVYSQLETNNNRVNDFKKASYSNYPSTKAVVNYVAEQLANVGGGSGVDLVTEFEGTDVDYKKNEVYHANIVNGLIAQLVELIEAKQNLLQDGENIKTINGQSILGEGNLSVGGGSTDGWKLLIDITIPEEDASVTLFVDKDSEGNPFKVEEINIVWQGIKVTDGTASGKAWISLNPYKAGYNMGSAGYSSASYFYYTSQNNYTSGEGIRLGKGIIWKTGSAETRIGLKESLLDGITSIEVSGDGRKSFYGRVVIYGR